MDTHYPYVPHSRFQIELSLQPSAPFEMLQMNTRIRENLVFSSEGLQKAIGLYDSAIRQLDGKIGEVLKFLKEHNLYDSSMIVLAADHGEEFQDHGDLQHKSKLFDELLRVPLMVKLPYSNIPAVSTEIVGLIDLAPTVLAQLRIDNPFDQTGFPSRMDNFNGRRGSAGMRTRAPFDSARDEDKPLLPYVIAETSYGINSAVPVDEQLLNIDSLPKLYCYRDRHWKMILDKGRNQTCLYNLFMDPNETHDVSDNYRDQANQLLRYLEEHSEFIEKKRLLSKIKKVQQKLNLPVNK
jgi:arylsulfatase A-like enzyme